MNAKTYFVDSEFETACDEYANKTQEVEAELADFIEKTKNIVSDKSLEGQTAEALQGFAEVVESAIREQLEDIGARFKVITSSFDDTVATDDDIDW